MFHGSRLSGACSLKRISSIICWPLTSYNPSPYTHVHTAIRKLFKMFRNNYDNDSVTFSPQGRIFQVEYAQEAVKQGSVVVGIVSKTHAVLAALKVHSIHYTKSADNLLTLSRITYSATQKSSPPTKRR